MEKKDIISKIQDATDKQVIVTDILIEIAKSLIEEAENNPEKADLGQIQELHTFAESSQNLSKILTQYTGKLISQL